MMEWHIQDIRSYRNALSWLPSIVITGIFASLSLPSTLVACISVAASFKESIEKYDDENKSNRRQFRFHGARLLEYLGRELPWDGNSDYFQAEPWDGNPYWR